MVVVVMVGGASNGACGDSSDGDGGGWCWLW